MGAEWQEKSSFGLSRPLLAQSSSQVNAVGGAVSATWGSRPGYWPVMLKASSFSAPEISARQRRTRQKKVTAAWLV
jgi:hypothetical protein